MFDLCSEGLMPAKYAYCGYGHPRPLWMEACPTCSERDRVTKSVTKSVTKPPTNVTPADVRKWKPVVQRGRPRKHQTDAERQAAYRGRRA